MRRFTGRERRRYVRVGAELATRVRVGDEMVTLPGFFVRDVSTGGLGVEMEKSWCKDLMELTEELQPVEFELLPPSGEPIRVAAERVWKRLDGEGKDCRCKAGFRFLEMDDRDRARRADLVKAKADEAARRRYGRRSRPTKPWIEPDTGSDGDQAGG